MSKRPASEKAFEKSVERQFAQEPSKSASLDGDAEILARLLRRWYGDEAVRVAIRIVEALES
jgi:hypothetical protein